MPRGKKRPSAAGAEAQAKRLNNGQRWTNATQFPLPAEAATPPVLDSAAVAALEAAYGGVKFPQELLKVYEFCLTACADDKGDAKPAAAFKTALNAVGLQPCGPFDYLLCYGAKISDLNGSEFDWLTHCRYAHDPPEFLTLFVATDRCSTDGAAPDEAAPASELHLGYVRHSPEILPAFLASNDARVDGSFVWLGDNILQCLALHAHRRNKSLPQAAIAASDKLLRRLAKFCNQPLDSIDVAQLQALSSSGSKSKTDALSKLRRHLRDKTAQPAVACTLNGLGLCVPLSDDGVGYRDLPDTDANLRRLLTRVAAKCDQETDRQARLTLLEPVDELVTLVQFANDEGDPGMGLELGLDLLTVPTSTGCYDDLIEGLLTTAYGLVRRPLYADIVRRHMAVRLRYRRGGAGGGSSTN